MNKALLDTDIYSEVLKAKNPNVAQNAALYRQQHGVYTVSVTGSITEILDEGATSCIHHIFQMRPPVVICPKVLNLSLAAGGNPVGGNPVSVRLFGQE